MNVIVICSDTFRFDHLGFLGQQPVSTPQLDQFARESAVFADFWLCSFPTLVNRIEVFTGRYTFPLYNWGKLPYEFPGPFAGLQAARIHHRPDRRQPSPLRRPLWVRARV